jgi:CBS domain-containing protein
LIQKTDVYRSLSEKAERRRRDYSVILLLLCVALGLAVASAIFTPVSIGAQVMTRNVATCDLNDSISSVIDRMMKGKFRHMPVLDKDRLAGLVSIGDVLKWHLETIREHLHQIETSLVEFELVRL